MPPQGRSAEAEAKAAIEAMRVLLRFAVYIRNSFLLKLIACMAVDVIGFSSYLLPMLGEAADLGWAPTQAFFLWFMFGSIRTAGIGLFEELGPGTDFVPTATIAWVCENVDADVPVLKSIRQAMGVRLRV